MERVVVNAPINPENVKMCRDTVHVLNLISSLMAIRVTHFRCSFVEETKLFLIKDATYATILAAIFRRGRDRSDIAPAGLSAMFVEVICGPHMFSQGCE